LVVHGPLAAFLQVVAIDVVMAGDNAIVIGMAAARVPKAGRKQVVFWGLSASVALRVLLATAAASILKIIGLTLAGGVLLLWVGWRFYRDIAQHKEQNEGADVVAETHENEGSASGATHGDGGARRRAILQIIAADLSMSLDNVLAVAGASLNHVWVLVAGLVLSVALMGIAAAQIAKLLQRFPWVSYAGVLIVFYVALRMIWLGGLQIFQAT
jgi:YjbE family integral membrane protein